MGKSEIIANIASDTGLSKAECERVVDSFAKYLTEALKTDGKVMIKNFMSAEVSERKERSGRNPKTGNVETFASVKTVKCKMSQGIRDAINGR